MKLSSASWFNSYHYPKDFWMSNLAPEWMNTPFQDKQKYSWALFKFLSYKHLVSEFSLVREVLGRN